MGVEYKCSCHLLSLPPTTITAAIITTAKIAAASTIPTTKQSRLQLLLLQAQLLHYPSSSCYNCCRYCEDCPYYHDDCYQY